MVKVFFLGKNRKRCWKRRKKQIQCTVKYCAKRTCEWSEIFCVEKVECSNVRIELLPNNIRWWSAILCCADSDGNPLWLNRKVYFRSGLLFEWMKRKFSHSERERRRERERVEKRWYRRALSQFIYEHRGRQIVTSERIKHSTHTHTHTHFPFSKQKIDNMNKLFDYCKLCSLYLFNPTVGDAHILGNFFSLLYELIGIECVVSRCSHRQKVAIVANNSILRSSRIKTHKHCLKVNESGGWWKWRKKTLCHIANIREK